MNVFRDKSTLEVGTEAFMGAKYITSKIQDVKIFNMETLRELIYRFIVQLKRKSKTLKNILMMVFQLAYFLEIVKPRGGCELKSSFSWLTGIELPHGDK